MGIQTFLDKIISATFGVDVRQAIHDAIKQVYDDAIQSGNTNMEVADARGTFSTLDDRLDATDDLINNLFLNYVDSVESCVTNNKLKLGDVITVRRFFADSEIIDARFKVVPYEPIPSVDLDVWTDFYNGIQYNQNGEFNIGNGRKLYYLTDEKINVKHFGACAQLEKYNDTYGLQNAINFLAWKDKKEQTYSTTGGSVYVPSGMYRITKPLVNKSQRLSLSGDGFSSILSADTGVPILLDLQVPRPLSATLTIEKMMLLNADVLINSTIVHVDCNISRVWFGQCKTHLKGSFVTLNLSNNTFELAKEGSVYCSAPEGFRKVVINANNFFGNSNFHIQILGAANDGLVGNVDITANMFDQVNSEVADNTESGGIRVVYADHVNIKENIFTGKGNTFKASCVRVLNSNHVEIDNIYSYCDSETVYVADCKYVDIKGTASDASRGALVARCEHVKFNMTVTDIAGIGVTFDSVTEFDFAGNVTKCGQTGVYLVGCVDGLVVKAIIEDNNTSDGASYGGLVIADPTKVSKRILVSNNITKGNKRSNIKVYNNCKDIVIKENMLGTDALSTIVDLGGTNITIGTNYSFVA